MTKRRHSLSLFEQPLDRAAAVVYFLGAVVPFGALGWLVVDRLHPTGFDLRADWFIALLGLVGALTLLSFFALRRLSRRTMALLERQAQDRSRILGASRALAAESESDEVLGIAAGALAGLVGAREGVAFDRGASGQLRLRARSGDSESELIRRPELERAAAAVLAPEGATVGDGASPRDGGPVAVACGPDAGPRVALVAWTADPARQPDEIESDALSTLGSLTGVALQNADLRQSERNFFTHVTNLLVDTLDRYLDDRSDHSRRVASLANRISRQLGLPEARRERLHFAALLHDIGMLHIPRAHADDRMLARRHVELGDAMLRPIRMWEDLALFVRHHHERWDGSGYPDGLAGERIPIESRVIAVAEAFDVMTADKSYKKAIPAAEALGRLEEASGSQFDPEVVRAMVTAQNADA